MSPSSVATADASSLISLAMLASSSGTTIDEAAREPTKPPAPREPLPPSRPPLISSSTDGASVSNESPYAPDPLSSTSATEPPEACACDAEASAARSRWRPCLIRLSMASSWATSSRSSCCSARRRRSTRSETCASSSSSCACVRRLASVARSVFSSSRCDAIASSSSMDEAIDASPISSATSRPDASPMLSSSTTIPALPAERREREPIASSPISSAIEADDSPSEPRAPLAERGSTALVSSGMESSSTSESAPNPRRPPPLAPNGDAPRSSSSAMLSSRVLEARPEASQRPAATASSSSSMLPVLWPSGEAATWRAALLRSRSVEHEDTSTLGVGGALARAAAPPLLEASARAAAASAAAASYEAAAAAAARLTRSGDGCAEAWALGGCWHEGDGGSGGGGCFEPTAATCGLDGRLDEAAS